MSRRIADVTPSAQGFISEREPFRFRVRCAPPPADCNLTVDLYDPSTPAHPEGHFGYWSFAAAGEQNFSIEIDPARRPAIRVLGHPMVDSWENPDLDLYSAPRVALNVVVQFVEQPPLEIQTFRWVRDPDVLAEAKTLLDAPAYIRALAPAVLELEPDARVHVVATGLRLGDAIGNLALDTARALRLHGFDTHLYARDTGPEFWGITEPVEALSKQAQTGDLVFYQYSVADPDLEIVLDNPATRVCFYQGVTPAHFFEGRDENVAAACRAGLAALPRLAAFDGLVAATSFTATELRAAVGESRRVHLVPPTLNLARFGEIEAAPLPAGLERFLLYVGRFAPHKGVDLVLDAFAAYSVSDPGCHLALAGMPGQFDVAARRAELAPELAARVHVIEQPSDAQLASLYQACTAYVSASQHEGFCVPLAEALGFGKPVFAYETPAVRETLGEAGWLFAERDPEALAELWRSVLLGHGVPEDRAVAIRSRGAELHRAADGHLLWQALADSTRRAT